VWPVSLKKRPYLCCLSSSSWSECRPVREDANDRSMKIIEKKANKSTNTHAWSIFFFIYAAFFPINCSIEWIGFVFCWNMFKYWIRIFIWNSSTNIWCICLKKEMYFIQKRNEYEQTYFLVSIKSTFRNNHIFVISIINRIYIILWFSWNNNFYIVF